MLAHAPYPAHNNSMSEHQEALDSSRKRRLPRETPALWFIVLGVWLLVAPQRDLAEPLPYAWLLAAFFLTRWLVIERRPAAMAFLGGWSAGGGLAIQFSEGSLRLALLVGAAGLSLWFTSRWNHPPWPELRTPGTLLSLIGAAGGFYLQFFAIG